MHPSSRDSLIYAQSEYKQTIKCCCTFACVIFQWQNHSPSIWPPFHWYLVLSYWGTCSLNHGLIQKMDNRDQFMSDHIPCQNLIFSIGLHFPLNHLRTCHWSKTHGNTFNHVVFWIIFESSSLCCLKQTPFCWPNSLTCWPHVVASTWPFPQLSTMRKSQKKSPYYPSMATTRTIHLSHRLNWLH